MRLFVFTTLLISASPVLAGNMDMKEMATATTKAAKAAKSTESATHKRAPLHKHPTLRSMWKRNNQLRHGVGLRPHRMSPILTKAAQDHAEFMARTGDFSHYSNGGPWGRARRYGFRGQLRENIAMGQRSVRGAFTAWQNSGAHWASIVSSTTEAGFGYALSDNGTPYWVSVYGVPEKNDE